MNDRVEWPKPIDVICRMTDEERARALPYLFGYAVGDDLDKEVEVARALHEFTVSHRKDRLEAATIHPSQP